MFLIISLMIIIGLLFCLAILDIERDIFMKFDNWKSCPVFNAKEINTISIQANKKDIKKERKNLKFFIRNAARNRRNTLYYNIRYDENVKYLEKLGVTVEKMSVIAEYTHEITWSNIT